MLDNCNTFVTFFFDSLLLCANEAREDRPRACEAFCVFMHNVCMFIYACSMYKYKESLAVR